MDVTMPGGVGIQVPEPLASAAEVESRLPKTVDVKVELAHVMESVKLIREALVAEKRDGGLGRK